MKNLTYLKSLLIAFGLLANSLLFAQGFTITGLTPANFGPTTPCDSLYSMQFSAIMPSGPTQEDVHYLVQGTNFTPSALIVAVDWGDGTNSTHQGTATSIGQNIVFNPAVSHFYPSPLPGTANTYSIVTTVYNSVNQSFALDSLFHVITSCNPTNAPIYGALNVDCDSNGVSDTTITDFPIVISGQGMTFSAQCINGMVNLNNIPAGNYTWTVDPSFLFANGYFIDPIFGSTLTVGPSPSTIFGWLYCTGTPPSYGCTNGIVFCDNNNNGVFDGNEQGIPNVPLFASYNGFNQSTTSTTNGFYSFDYLLNSTASIAVVTIGTAWLAQNGYQITNSIVVDSNVNCFSQNLYNFAVNCDSAIVQNECATGWVFCDANANGILDQNESGIPFAPVTLWGNSNNSIVVYTDSNGIWSYSGQSFLGSAVVVSIPSWWLTQHGYTITLNGFALSTNCVNPTITYFAVNCSPTMCADLWTAVTPWIGYFQNTTNSINVKWGNNGPNSTTGYTLTLTYPSSVTPVLSSIQNANYVVSGNTITWTFGVGASYIYQTDIIYFNVPAGYPSGTAHTYSTVITATGSTTDCDALNNDGSLCMILGNSYDPNDKSVSLPPVIDPVTQDELTYVIRFQNTGTAPAQDVYIIDSLSSNLDWSTLKVISASHNMQLIDLGGGVMKFNFPGIWLPDSTANEPASHGDVVFSIKENATNTVGSTIENTGFIYFDWNPAIVTNTTVNSNAYLGLEDTKVSDVSIFPNPTTGKLNVVSSSLIEKIVVIDLIGKEITFDTVNNLTTQLDITNLAAGTYLVKLYSKGNIITQRIVKK